MIHTTPLETHVSPVETGTRRVSAMAEGLAGSQILGIAAEIRSLTAQGKTIGNLTVGDFSPKEFRIPAFLENAVIRRYRDGETNYPPSDGVMELRRAVRQFYREWLGLDYDEPSILIASGARPIIYGVYRAVVDPGEKVIYPTPSWNNNYYVHMIGADGVALTCDPSNAFLPTRDLLEPHVHDAVLLSLNSPLNPTGTAFSEDALAGICDLVLEENRRRGASHKPLYLMYDQVYWMLTFGDTRHVHPVALRPEIASYVIYIDAVSKSFAATGVRVGWCAGPPDVVSRMSAILGHVGAWAPRAEQLAVSELLIKRDEIESYHRHMKSGIQSRLDLLYRGMKSMESAGLPVRAIPPMGAIYLTVRFDCMDKKLPSGRRVESNEQIRQYLLHEAGFAAVPFEAFAYEGQPGWFRLSVGAVSESEIESTLPRVRHALERL